jgi:hypothetical protein
MLQVKRSFLDSRQAGVPHRLRYRLAFDRTICRAALGVFVRAVLGWYRRAPDTPGLPTAGAARSPWCSGLGPGWN